MKKEKDLHVVVCTICELISLKGHWTNFYLADIGTIPANIQLDTLISQEWDFFYKVKQVQTHDIKLEEDVNGYPSDVTGIVDITASPDPFVPLMTISQEFTAHIDWGECSECRTRFSGSYTSKLQIRSPKEVEESHLEAWSSEIETMSQSYPLSDGKNPLIKINFLKTGLDALFQTKPSAYAVGRTFASKYAGIITVTTEFAGFDKSKSKEYPRKPVVLITLPEFDPGEIVILNDRPVQILGYNAKVEYWNFNKNRKEKVPIKSFVKSKPQLLEEEFRQFQLVNFEQGGKEAQIMDTNNFETYFINANDIAGFSEGMVFEGILFNGTFLLSQKNK